jgi:hypothetical protein
MILLTRPIPGEGKGNDDGNSFCKFESIRGDFMKRIPIPTGIFLAALTLGLAACGAQITPAGGTHTAGRLNADYENALPVESQLVLGTLLLEDTGNAVTTEEAAELLPLWQMMKELTTSDTAATEEKGGLIDQIQGLMTQEQIQAIADMKLTQKDMFDYMQKAGLAQGPKQSGTPAASGAADGNFPIDGGGAPPAGFDPGGMPAGGGGMQAGGPFGGANPNQNLTTEQIATLEARRASGGGGGNSSALIDTLIQLLEAKQAS